VESRCSRLQLAFELVEKAPIGVFRDDLLRRFFDCAVFAQAQRIEADRVLGIVVTPFVVRKVLQRLQRIVVALGEAPPSLPAAASPNTPSFLLWPDKSAHKMQTLRS
jgi:hypothetical protein